jgi:hypothetical protein
MDVEEGLELAERLLKRPLKQLEILIFEESWKGREGKKYREIAEIYPCTEGHVNDAASNLWKLISQALGKKVFKSNFRRELEKHSRSHSAEVPQPQESVQEETASKNTDFVGREDAINDIDNFVNQGAKVILIQAEGGVGKTTLAQKWFEHQGLEPLLLRVGMTSQNIQSPEDWVRHKLLNDFQENPARNFLTMLEQLRVKLQTQRIGVLIDNLEPALINGEFIEPHQSYYVELLTVLAHPSVQSITLVTSCERLHEHKVISLPTVRTYPLEPLKEKAWKEYFHNRHIDTNIYALSKMYEAYGGNAEVMYILSGDIHQQPWKGNLEAYWQQNHDDLLRHRSLKSLVKRQFNKLKEDNRPAYDLLCRLGFYPERDVPFVPNVWLRCLLWDVPEKNRQQVIDDLCDRSLVKVSDEGYYLHPVIQAEAVDRHEAKSEHLIQIKNEVDALLTQDQEIQDALSWISKRFSLVSEGYKKAAFRAFYLGAILEHHLFYTFSSLEENFKYFNIACCLDSRFEIVCGINACKEAVKTADYISRKVQTKVIEIAKANSRKYFNNVNEVNEAIKEAKNELFEELYQFYREISYKSDEYAKDISDIQFEISICLCDPEEEIISLKKNGQLDIVKRVSTEIFTKAFRSSINKKITRSEFRNMLNGKIKTEKSQRIFRGIENYKYKLFPNFSKEQEKLLQQYYEVNLLLVYCLDKASDIVRSQIEDELLLPIAEIEARRRLRE